VARARGNLCTAAAHAQRPRSKIPGNRSRRLRSAAAAPRNSKSSADDSQGRAQPAWREGRVATDDAWRRVEPYEEADAARVRYLTIDECRRLINAAEGPFCDLVRAALLTGCRYGELAALEVHDFNPDAGTLHVRTSKSGKGRHVVLNDEGIGFFAALAAGGSGAEILLRRPDGRRWLKSHQSRPMAEACARAKIEPPANFHALRHSYASHSVMNGVPLMIVAKNLGHADTRMVEKHYGHLARSFIVDAIRAGAPRFGIAADDKVVPITGAH
jgi:integrase